MSDSLSFFILKPVDKLENVRVTLECGFHKMLRGSISIESFLGNKMFPYDLKENAASDSSVLLPIRVVRMTYCESPPLPFDLPFLLSSNQACFDSA